MKTAKYLRLLLMLAIFALGVMSVSAQDDGLDDGPSDGDRPAAGRQQEPRFNLLRQLGLSREQIRKIRRMNQARKPLIAAAQQNFREASRLLDAAIYADVVNEEDVRARLKDVQLAQAELVRIRSMDELAVRRILTAEQLVKFRELRASFNETRPMFRGGQRMKALGAGRGFAKPDKAKIDQPPAEAKEKP